MWPGDLRRKAWWGQPICLPPGPAVQAAVYTLVFGTTGTCLVPLPWGHALHPESLRLLCAVRPGGLVGDSLGREVSIFWGG